MEKAYYRFLGYYPYGTSNPEQAVFCCANGIKIKCLTEEEVRNLFQNSCELWEKVQ